MDRFLSIIVPVYSVEEYLDRCVESLVNQTYQNIEILLVDDGSPDNCPQMCDAWAQRDERIKVIHKVNGGLSSARNAGLDIARGEYISFVDSDDWLALDMAEQVMAIFHFHDPDIVTFDCNRINEKGEIYDTTEDIREAFLSPEEALVELLKGKINNYACNKVYKKHVFSGIRFPEGRVWEDMAVAYKLFLNAKSVYCYPHALYFYYTRSASLSKNITEKALAHIFLARYECHMTVTKELPALLQYSLPLAALSARRLYDRSLWKPVDLETLNVALEFLAENREIILHDTADKKLWFFYKFPKLYRLIRVTRHKIGKIVKRRF